MRPAPAGRHQPAAARATIESRRDGGLRARRAGDATPTPPSTRWCASAIRCCRDGDPGRRVAAAAQHGEQRRQPAAAHALLLLLRPASPCNKREPGTGCAARSTASHRMHAILGASEQCIATHPSDMCVALAALEAMVRVTVRRRRARSRSRTSIACPATRREIDTTLAHGELITAIDLPPPAFAAHCAYLKMRDARRTRSRWSRWRRRWTSDGGDDARLRGWRSAAWRTSRGAIPTPRRCWSAGPRSTDEAFRARGATPVLAGAAAATATTPSRSRLAAPSPCARARCAPARPA